MMLRLGITLTVCLGAGSRTGPTLSPGRIRRHTIRGSDKYHAGMSRLVQPMDAVPRSLLKGIIWPYQPHFETSLYNSAKSALEKIGYKEGYSGGRVEVQADYS